MPAPIDPRQWEEAARWLHFVDEDLRAVEILLAADPPAVATAAFHCQQAAEKMAKAMLVALKTEVPKIHDVTELARLVSSVESEIGKGIAELGGLTNWYLSVRYADIGSDVAASRQDVHTALKNLQRLRQRIASFAPKAR